MALRGLDPPDAILVEELSRGSSAALGQLFDRHADAIYNYCFRRTASWHRAEDATSTVFFELWRGRTRVRTCDESVLPWLYGIARNVCRAADRSDRRLARALRRVPPEGMGSDADAMADDVAGRLDSERQMAALHTAIAQLPGRERDVFELVVWSGVSYQAAAAALNVPVGTVRSRLSRARAHLASALREGAGDQA